MTQPNTAKRSPSILVTDVRKDPGRSAPFVRLDRPREHPRFDKISISNILSDVSEIPSGHSRAYGGAKTGVPYRGYGSTGTGVPIGGGSTGTGVGSSSVSGPSNINNNSSNNNNSSSNNIGSASNNTYSPHSPHSPHNTNTFHNQMLSSEHRPKPRKPAPTPPVLTQSLPVRTTKVSEKLVLIPDEGSPPSFKFEDDDDDDRPPRSDRPRDLSEDSGPRPSYAERLPKDKRTLQFPRVTAYCVSDAVRLHAAADFLRTHHHIRPRIYDEALYAPYYLPLLPGDEDSETRVRSSPGSILLLEQRIDRSEQGDHHYEFYSGKDNAEDQGDDSTEQIVPDGESHDDSVDHDQDWVEPTFDPSEPQHFSPREPSMLHGRAELEHSPMQPLEPILEEDSDEVNEENEHPESVQDEQSDNDETQDSSEVQTLAPPHHHDLNHAEMFIFSYGVIVFWNFTEKQERDVLADLSFARWSGKGGLRPLLVRPIADSDIETEELHFHYSPQTNRPRIYNDMITLKSGDHMIKLAMSHGLAQSTKLSRFEARMSGNMHDVKHVPRMLALTGRLGMDREAVLKISGKLFKLRVDVNLSSNVLDTPEFFWEDEPSLNPLYTAVREYLEIEQRILVINERCKVFLDLTDIIADSIAESNMSRITWIIIVLIVLSLAVSTLEIAMRFRILRNAH